VQHTDRSTYRPERGVQQTDRSPQRSERCPCRPLQALFDALRPSLRSLRLSV
jgi:hypothetical protein